MSLRQFRKLLEGQQEQWTAMDQAARDGLEPLIKKALEGVDRAIEKASATLGAEAFTTAMYQSLRVQLTDWYYSHAIALENGLLSQATDWRSGGMEAMLAQLDVMEGPVALPLRLDLIGRLEGGAKLRDPLVFARYGGELVAELEQRLAMIMLKRLSRQEAVSLVRDAAKDVIQKQDWRARLIYRNELTGLYDDGAREVQERLASSAPEATDDPLLARMDEAIDRRNHPFSRVAHGTVAKVGEDWKVSESAVLQKAAQMKIGATGIVWLRRKGSYVGRGYIAHHNDRGRRTLWRRSWGDPEGV